MASRLSQLMGLATFTLPIYHAAAYAYSAMFLWTNRYRPVSVPNYEQLDTLAFYITFVVRQLSAYGIPIFLFVAGFFIAFMSKRGPGGPSWSAVLKRIQKLAPPYLIWTVITSALLLRVPTVSEILWLYYFIPLLGQYYILSPLIVPLAKTRWKLLLVVTAAVQLGLHSLRYMQDIGVTFAGQEQLLLLTPLWFFPSRIFYFALGIVGGLHLESFRGWLQERKQLLIAAVAVSCAMMFVEHEALSAAFGKLWLGPTFNGIARHIYGVTFVLLFIGVDDISLPFSDVFERLGRKSLGVFLVNTPVIYVLSSLMYHMAPWMMGSQLIYQGLLITFGLGIPLLAMWTVNRSPLRGLYTYLFG